VQTLNGVGGPRAFPLARRQAGEGEETLAGLLQAVGDVTMTQPPLGDELATPILDILALLWQEYIFGIPESRLS
jgi:hypothetical protein